MSGAWLASTERVAGHETTITSLASSGGVGGLWSPPPPPPPPVAVGISFVVVVFSTFSFVAALVSALVVVSSLEAVAEVLDSDETLVGVGVATVGCATVELKGVESVGVTTATVGESESVADWLWTKTLSGSETSSVSITLSVGSTDADIDSDEDSIVTGALFTSVRLSETEVAVSMKTLTKLETGVGVSSEVGSEVELDEELDIELSAEFVLVVIVELDVELTDVDELSDVLVTRQKHCLARLQISVSPEAHSVIWVDDEDAEVELSVVGVIEVVSEVEEVSDDVLDVVEEVEADVEELEVEVVEEVVVEEVDEVEVEDVEVVDVVNIEVVLELVVETLVLTQTQAPAPQLEVIPLGHGSTLDVTVIEELATGVTGQKQNDCLATTPLLRISGTSSSSSSISMGKKGLPNSPRGRHTGVGHESPPAVCGGLVVSTTVVSGKVGVGQSQDTIGSTMTTPSLTEVAVPTATQAGEGQG